MIVVSGIPVIDRVILDQLWRLRIDLHDPFTVLGVACDQRECSELARWTCYWPGQTTRSCARHRDHTARIASAMGFELLSLPILGIVDDELIEDASAVRFALMELDR